MPFIWILKQEDAPLLWATPSPGSLYKGMKEGNFHSLTACSCLANKSIPSPALEPASSGLQCLLKTSWDIQTHELSNYWILGLFGHSQSLSDLLDHSLSATLINCLYSRGSGSAGSRERETLSLTWASETRKTTHTPWHTSSNRTTPTPTTSCLIQQGHIS